MTDCNNIKPTLIGWVVKDYFWLPKLEITLTQNKNKAILEYFWHSKWKLLYQQFADQLWYIFTAHWLELKSLDKQLNLLQNTFQS